MFALLAMSAFFSASETSFSGVSRSRLKVMAEDGNKKADLVLHMSQDYDKLLSTILVGNNIVNIGLSSLATVWFTSMLKSGGASVSTIVTTVLVLIFGEITPKSLAKEAPEKFAMALAPMLRLCVLVLTPINWIFTQWKKLLRSVISVEEDRVVDGEELLAIVSEAEREGGIDDVESQLIQNAIEFGDHNAIEIATPRVDVTAVSEEATRESVERTFAETGFSRLPVYKGSVDNIIGILHQKDFLVHKDWHKGIQQPLFVTETMDVGALLKQMQRNKSHMAVISDEFGGTAGIVTMEDILEELVGDIWDEHDERIEPVIHEGDGIVSISGDLVLDEMMEELEIRYDDQFEAGSVSGWVMEVLKTIPSKGDSFVFADYHFEVTEVSHRRVLRIKAYPTGEREKQTEEN